jgi:hypothetical protein
MQNCLPVLLLWNYLYGRWNRQKSPQWRALPQIIADSKDVWIEITDSKKVVVDEKNPCWLVSEMIADVTSFTQRQS